MEPKISMVPMLTVREADKTRWRTDCLRRCRSCLVAQPIARMLKPVVDAQKLSDEDAAGQRDHHRDGAGGGEEFTVGGRHRHFG